MNKKAMDEVSNVMPCNRDGLVRKNAPFPTLKLLSSYILMVFASHAWAAESTTVSATTPASTATSTVNGNGGTATVTHTDASGATSNFAISGSDDGKGVLVTVDNSTIKLSLADLIVTKAIGLNGSSSSNTLGYINFEGSKDNIDSVYIGRTNTGGQFGTHNSSNGQNVVVGMNVTLPSQTESAWRGSNIILGNNITSSHGYATLIGNYAESTSSGAIVIGATGNKEGATIAGRDSTVIGYNIKAGDSYGTLALGGNYITEGQGNMVMNSGTTSCQNSACPQVKGNDNVVIGAKNNLKGMNYTSQSISGLPAGYKYTDVTDNTVLGASNTINGGNSSNPTSKNIFRFIKYH